MLAAAAASVLGLFATPSAAPAEPPAIRSRKKGAAYRRCYNEQRVGDKLIYFHATKGRRQRRVPA